MGDEKPMNLADYLTFIRENIDAIYVRWEGKSVRLSEVPTDEALIFIWQWWKSGQPIHIVIRDHSESDN